MLPQYVCAVLVLVFVQKGCCLKCYQCEEVNLHAYTVDASCKDPRGKNAYAQLCNSNEVCMKYRTPVSKVDTINSEQATSRFCGTKDGCDLKDQHFGYFLQDTLGKLQQATQLHQATPEELQLMKQLEDTLSSRKLKGECYSCNTELCNFSSDVFPSSAMVVSALLVLKYCFF